MSHQSALMSGSGTPIDIHQLTRVQDPGLATEFHRWPLVAGVTLPNTRPDPVRVCSSYLVPLDQRS